ncbi:MAG: antitoxin (DNA-binding transcriptional repressor) of toxin-antitoxin stability system [Limisphaerales bacterium]|jgi:antitoxin (DNA-binding transcriptional repressor) of toxin-antitoxin stability system
MKMITVHSAKTIFSRLLAEIESGGESIRICRNGHSVAELSPHKSERDLSPDPIFSKVEIDYDPTEEMSEAEWPRES